MHLTQFSDYSLRVALYLAAHPDKQVTVEEISRSYRISRNHLTKVVQRMADLGVVASTRGRGGGFRLAMDPADINVGWLVRQTEPHFDLVECFDPATNTCPIAPACGLKGALARAQQAFLKVLNEYTLASFQGQRRELLSIWEVFRPDDEGAGGADPG
ncbi:RrF2 family transcriptional regulator [Tundrisphaera lichenicola]|uniref:RrF2 family transcriptional regulator n=1 Tax=Tundrisphaera lichenicola TaxID=2029860 RepID=UPI003EC1038E